MDEKEIARKRQELLDIHKYAAMHYYATLRKEIGKPGMEYFKKRELGDDILKDFGLGFSSKSGDDLYKYLSSKGFSDDILSQSGLVAYDENKGWRNKFWNRVMFPITNINGEVIGFGGRVMDDSKPKYLNSPETLIFDKSNNLYALDKASKSERPYFILCEGYMDVISLHKAGFDCAIAALGTAYTQNHANIIRKFTKHVYLSFDSDGPGINAALRAIPICKSAGLECRIINMKPYKDPDEFIKNLGRDEFEKRIEEAENEFLFRLRVEKERLDPENLDDKISFYQTIAKEISDLDENKIEDITKEI